MPTALDCPLVCAWSTYVPTPCVPMPSALATRVAVGEFGGLGTAPMRTAPPDPARPT
jgi:hypothetical protein